MTQADQATPAARAEKLAAELEAAFRNRADLYRLLLEELTGEIGGEAAEAVMTRTVTRYGQEIAAAAFAGFGPNDAKALGEAFLAASPNGGRMYPTDVERGTDSVTFKVKRCPLKDAWVAAGVGDEKLTTLCRIAGAFDRGLFETTGVRFSNVTWSPDHGSGCCRIQLANRNS